MGAISFILSLPLHHGHWEGLAAECLRLIGLQVDLLCQAHSTSGYICTSDGGVKGIRKFGIINIQPGLLSCHPPETGEWKQTEKVIFLFIFDEWSLRTEKTEEPVEIEIISIGGVFEITFANQLLNYLPLAS